MLQSLQKYMIAKGKFLEILVTCYGVVNIKSCLWINLNQSIQT